MVRPKRIDRTALAGDSTPGEGVAIGKGPTEMPRNRPIEGLLGGDKANMIAQSANAKRKANADRQMRQGLGHDDMQRRSAGPPISAYEEEEELLGSEEEALTGHKEGEVMDWEEEIEHDSEDDDMSFAPMRDTISPDSSFRNDASEWMTAPRNPDERLAHARTRMKKRAGMEAWAETLRQHHQLRRSARVIDDMLYRLDNISIADGGRGRQEAIQAQTSMTREHIVHENVGVDPGAVQQRRPGLLRRLGGG